MPAVHRRNAELPCALRSSAPQLFVEPLVHQSSFLARRTTCGFRQASCSSGPDRQVTLPALRRCLRWSYGMSDIFRIVQTSYSIGRNMALVLHPLRRRNSCCRARRLSTAIPHRPQQRSLQKCNARVISMSKLTDQRQSLP